MLLLANKPDYLWSESSVTQGTANTGTLPVWGITQGKPASRSRANSLRNRVLLSVYALGRVMPVSFALSHYGDRELPRLYRESVPYQLTQRILSTLLSGTCASYSLPTSGIVASASGDDMSHYAMTHASIGKTSA